jgi:putative intracellular protease/amidase
MQLTAARVRIRVSRPISPVASKKDAEAEGQLDKTVRLDSVKQEDYDTVFYPGGHGPLWDLAEGPNSIKLIESFLAAEKLVALVGERPRRPMEIG